MNWLLILLMVVCLIFIVLGSKHGLVRMHVSLLFLVLIFAISIGLNQKTTAYLNKYTSLNKVFTKAFSTMVAERTQESDGNLTLGEEVTLIQGLPLPASIRQGLLKNNDDAGYQAVNATGFSDYVSAYLGGMMVRAVAFLLTFLVLFIILRIFLSITNLMTKLPAISQMNNIGGAMLGLVEAFLWIGAFFMLVTLIADTHIGTVIMNAVKGSSEVSWIYNHNLFWFLLEAVLML